MIVSIILVYLKPLKRDNAITIVRSSSKVAAFSNSISRNSVSSKDMYLIGLVYFQDFLSKSFPRQSVENILLPIFRTENRSLQTIR